VCTQKGWFGVGCQSRYGTFQILIRSSDAVGYPLIIAHISAALLDAMLMVLMSLVGATEGPNIGIG